jgi:putative ABC transport system permease protein
VSALTEVFRDVMELFIGFMSVVVIAVLALAFLIAFNSTSINIDERSREIATLFAFGLPIRTVTRMTMIENLVTGVLGTAAGLGLGYVTLVWMLNSRVDTMMPDIGMTITVSNLSLILAVLLGVVVVALTPLLSIRKMARMDLPSTLRVME